MPKEIKFRNIGRTKQHEVTLFKFYELLAKIDNDLNEQSFAERRLTFYMQHAQDYLERKGFNDTTGHFCITNGKVVKSDEVWLPLFAAIEERDRVTGGQTGEYLAALIDHKCRMLLNAWPPIHNECSAVLDTVMLIQEYFFRLFLLDEVHALYSAGRHRTHEVNEEKNKQNFMEEAQKICRDYRGKGENKKNCYKKTSEDLIIEYGNSAPSEHTIKSWFIAGKISF